MYAFAQNQGMRPLFARILLFCNNEYSSTLTSVLSSSAISYPLSDSAIIRWKKWLPINETGVGIIVRFWTISRLLSKLDQRRKKNIRNWTKKSVLLFVKIKTYSRVYIRSNCGIYVARFTG